MGFFKIYEESIFPLILFEISVMEKIFPSQIFQKLWMEKLILHSFWKIPLFPVTLSLIICKKNAFIFHIFIYLEFLYLSLWQTRMWKKNIFLTTSAHSTQFGFFEVILDYFARIVFSASSALFGHCNWQAIFPRNICSLLHYEPSH